MMYTPHIRRDQVDGLLPLDLETAARNVHRLEFKSLRCMRDVVFRLASLVEALRPTLFPFFATGAIPYVIPAIRRLADLGASEFVDGKVFHMFPGLAWQTTSRSLFAREFGTLLESGGPHRVLCADTTGVGNAVNNAVKALMEACASTTDHVDVRVVGILDGSKAIEQDGRAVILVGDEPGAYVRLPGGLKCEGPIRDSEFQEFTGPSIPQNVRLEIAYWVVPEVPTEDRAELIGAVGLHDALSLETVEEAGRIELVSENGEAPQMTGLDSVSKRLLHQLSKDDDSPFWQWAMKSAALPPASRDVEEFRQETEWIRKGFLRYFELSNDPNAIENLRESKVPMTGEDIQFLTDKGVFEEPFVARVRHVLESASPGDWRLIEVANAYLARADAE